MADAYGDLLIEKRQKAWDAQKSLVDSALTETRAMSGEEIAEYTRINADLDSLRSQIDQHVEAGKVNAATEARMAELAAKPSVLDAPKDNKGSDELRSFLKGEKRAIEFNGSVGSSMVERRANLSVGTATAGGNTVPIGFYGKLWANLILTAQLINNGATVWNTTNGDQIQVPTTTAHSTAVLVAEATALTESDPVFGQRALGAYKYGVLISVSRELTTDTGVDLEGYLAMEAGRAVGNAYGTHLISGTGTGQPTGLLTSTTLGVTGATGVIGMPNFDNLIDLYHSVISPYRQNPSTAWGMNDTTVGAIRKLKDSTGRYLWQPALNVGDPDTILNKPVFTDPNIPATALNAKSVVFGDLSAYVARTVSGIRFEQSVDYAFNTDLIVFRCLFRGDGILVDQTGAVKHFVGAAS